MKGTKSQRENIPDRGNHRCTGTKGGNSKSEVSNRNYCGFRVGSEVIRRVVSVFHIAQGQV